MGFEYPALLFRAPTGKGWELLTDSGLIEFPFDAVHVDFTLKAA